MLLITKMTTISGTSNLYEGLNVVVMLYTHGSARTGFKKPIPHMPYVCVVG